jgi:class 3 adenylate cyclase
MTRPLVAPSAEPGEDDPVGAPHPGGLVTFLRTDIEGSSRLWQTPGGSMDSAIDLHDGVVAAAIQRNGGAVERAEGDSFFATFARPTQAAAAGYEIQRDLDALVWPGTTRPRVRVGIHTGEAGRVGPGGRVDTRGLEANICGRVSDLARGGQVLMTLHAALFARHALPEGTALRDHGWHVLRDVAEPQRLYELVAESAAAGRGDLEPPPLGSHTQEDTDRRLAELRRKLQTVATNLREFQDLAEYRLLLGTGDEPGEHLAGETRARVLPAFQAMQRLSLQLDDLERLSDRAAQLRGTAPRLRADRLQELATMLFGPSIRLHTGRIPIELRSLVEDPDAYLSITPDDLLRALENAFEFARAVVLDVKDATGRLGPSLERAGREVEAVAAQARSLGEDALLEELAGAGGSVEALIERSRRDPLGMAADADGAVVPPLEEARSRLAEVQRRRDAIPSDLERARELLAEGATVRAAAEREQAWARERIVRPLGLVDPPDPTTLYTAAAELARVEGMTESGSWRPARERLDELLLQAERTLEEARRALAANRGPRERREEMRGLLAALGAKRLRIGLGEDPEVSALAVRARTLLWTAPTDLEAAERAVDVYRERLAVPPHGPGGPPPPPGGRG